MTKSKHAVQPKQMYEFMKKYNQHLFPHERLGQAFINEFFTDKQDPELFYCEDNYDAYQIIMSKYVDWDWTA